MELSKRVCKKCEKDISNLPGQARFCSTTCRQEMYYGKTFQKIVDTTCLNCSTTFVPRTRKPTRFCSVKCMYEYRAKLHRDSIQPRACQYCTQTFKPARRNQIYCSDDCRFKMMKIAYHGGFSATTIRTMPEPVIVSDPLERRADVNRPPLSREVPEGMTTPLCGNCGLAHVETEIDVNCEACKKILQEAMEKRLVGEATRKWEGTPK